MRAGQKKQQQQERTLMKRSVDIDGTVTEPTRMERQDVPEGVHELQIVQVIEDPAPLDVRLQHDDRKYGWVFCKFPDGDSRADARLATLISALGMTKDDWDATPPGDLVGRRVLANVWHRGRDNGAVWVNVSAFLPIEQLEQEAAVVAKKPARTPAAKVRAASPAIGSDDIPF
jgi:hypothetical protein